LYVMDKDGSNVRQITNLNDMGGRSTWSPDGTRLAFYRGPAGDRDIFIINVDGTAWNASPTAETISAPVGHQTGTGSCSPHSGMATTKFISFILMAEA
jgi:Tol biopolymer transport system component